MVNCKVLVVGSGPGGAITAALLAEAGLDVVLVEEGSSLPLDSAKSYSSDEMDQKYRGGGLTVAFGKNKIAYAEAKCLGGGSEINAALFHPPLSQTIEEWEQRYHISEFKDSFFTHLDAVTADLSVSFVPGKLSTPSIKLQEGAKRLNWRFAETARCFKYKKKNDEWIGERQSMSQTYIPRAQQAGCRILPNTKVIKIIHKKGRATKIVAIQNNKLIEVLFEDLVLCAGAVQTPYLLRKSGIYHNIGNSLRLHPMVRLAATFPEEINDDEGVPVSQIEEFKPGLTLGCSCSSRGHLALWLDGTLSERTKKIHEWKRMGIFYAALTPEGIGRVRSIPYISEPFVSYKLTQKDMQRLGEGLYRLGEVLFAAGAQELTLPMSGFESIRSLEELIPLRHGIAHGKIPITAIHLFSSCPMGENKRVCAVDSYGKLHNFSNIYISDGSILPECPGVNPQATIMAIAHRNAAHFLSKTLAYCE